MTDAASPAPSTPTSPPTDPPPDVRCCPRCGYDLTGRDASGTCPECGREYTPETVLIRPLPGPFMLCVRYLWPFIGFAIATVFPFRSNDPYAMIAVLVLLLPLAVVLLVNGIVQWALLRRHVPAAPDGYRRPIRFVSVLAFLLTGFTIIVPSLFLAGCLFLIVGGTL